MKKGISILIVVVLFMACQKTFPSIQKDVEFGILKAKIDGNQFTSKLVRSGFVETYKQGFEFDRFSIWGYIGEYASYTAPNILISFTVPSDEEIEPLEYHFEGDNCTSNTEICGFVMYNYSLNNKLNGSTKTQGGDVIFEFSSIDYKIGGHAIGTFSGTLINENGEEAILTDGEFNITIPK